jgi:hypothetical protein
MPIESSHNISGARPVGAVDARIVRTAAGAKDQQAIGASPATNPTATSATGAAYQPSTALDPGRLTRSGSSSSATPSRPGHTRSFPPRSPTP